MTRTETLKILTILKAAYRQFYAKQPREYLEQVVELWSELFAEEDYQTVAVATKAVLKTRTSDFPPTPGEINAKVVELTQPQDLSAMEAWSLVNKALHNGIHGAEKEFNRLPDICKQIVGRPQQLRDWALMDEQTVQSVVASNFRQSYTQVAKRKREYMAMPSEARAYIDRLAAGMEQKQIGGASGGD